MRACSAVSSHIRDQLYLERAQSSRRETRTTRWSAIACFACNGAASIGKYTD